MGWHVALDDLRVVGPAKDARGFVGQGPSGQSFVLPSMASDQSDVPAGAIVDVRGVVMQMPERMRDRLSPSGPLNGEIYILANAVEAVLPIVVADQRAAPSRRFSSTSLSTLSSSLF